MARATRSQDTTKSPKHISKKRKLGDDATDDHTDKFHRTDAPPLASTQPIDTDTAEKILHILDSIDEQGLLDRVYEPPHSLRSLLQSPSSHSLATLKAAALRLRPLSAQPRLPLSGPAAQQQRFCDTALSLLEQASFPITATSLLPDDDDSERRLLTTKRYALVQRLPDGDYFTSVNLDQPAGAPESGTADLRDLPTGHADLVAVLPAPSVSTLPTNLPTLGSYRIPLSGAAATRFVPPAPRRLSHGTFLDYGPHASFAPTWAQDGAEVGMRQMGEYYSQRARRHKERFLALKEAAAAAANRPPPAAEKPQPAPPESPSTPDPIDPDLDGLRDILAPSEIDALTSVLGNLQIESSVQELLERNRRALRRLAQLQTRRLRLEDGKPVKEGDEEWDLAQNILSSLTLLASLRPRSSAHPTAPLIPPPDVVHTLMRTLPRNAVPGWHGTLTRPSGSDAKDKTPLALRGDQTVRVRPGVAAKPPPAPAPTPMELSTPGPGTPAAFATQYQSYYTPQLQPQQQQRYGTRGATTSLSAAQQHAYYQQQQQAGYGGSTTQIPYGTNWVQYSATPTHSAYGAAVATGSKAVANTVLMRNASNWGAGTAPALPAHLRTGG
ncbi:hypothetical protein HMN09_00593100 [Mycena chlorophos]|uniref:Uncharacterized protein n=1 Tax=Mycena chlorophos TaxID=658473 RepID=A0A8H6T3R8_MYCCL|nr:hypothetical protein HMN09_00593100 [Mycena chlorophos]